MLRGRDWTGFRLFAGHLLLGATALPGSGRPGLDHPGGAPLVLQRHHPDDVGDFMHAAFRVWVTEVRPYLLEAGRNCAGGPPREACVLLAQLQFDVEEIDSLLRVSGDVSIDQKDRPILLNTRLFQEYMTIEGLGRQLP